MCHVFSNYAVTDVRLDIKSTYISLKFDVSVQCIFFNTIPTKLSMCKFAEQYRIQTRAGCAKNQAGTSKILANKWLRNFNCIKKYSATLNYDADLKIYVKTTTDKFN